MHILCRTPGRASPRPSVAAGTGQGLPLHPSPHPGIRPPVETGHGAAPHLGAGLLGPTIPLREGPASLRGPADSGPPLQLVAPLLAFVKGSLSILHPAPAVGPNAVPGCKPGDAVASRHALALLAPVRTLVLPPVLDPVLAPVPAPGWFLTIPLSLHVVLVVGATHAHGLVPARKTLTRAAAARVPKARATRLVMTGTMPGTALKGTAAESMNPFKPTLQAFVPSTVQH